MAFVGINAEMAQEQDLIRQAQTGQTQAFDVLYRRHVDRIYRYIYYRVESPTTAEDLTADVFLRALESLPAFEDRAVPLVSWLYRIAHARIIDHYRRTRRNGNFDNIDKIEIGSDEDIDLSLMADHQAGAVHEALTTLTPEQQQVIVIRFLEGCSLEKTSEILGKTVGAVKALQHRALQNLSKALNRQGFTFEQD
jgi:RNA polymerase sigma-70 factor (ECF subfamily)